MKREKASIAIDVRRVGKTFESQGRPITAFEDVTFTVADGEFVSLVGPSGCGKSTLLQIIGGLATSSSGDVYVEGRKVTEPMPDRVAIVFQDAMLMPWKTVIRNVEFPLELHGIERSIRRVRAIEQLELVGLREFADRYPHELSGGMRQRVAIARCLAQKPEIILMDEPFAALDEQNRLKMGNELLRILEATGKTVFFITHSLTEALYLSDTILVMSERPGRIIDTVTVDLPRPRAYAMMSSPAFGVARDRIWNQLVKTHS